MAGTIARTLAVVYLISDLATFQGVSRKMHLVWQASAWLIDEGFGMGAGSFQDLQYSTRSSSTSPFLPIDRVLCSGMLGARLADVLGGAPVHWMLISNYMIDVGWLLSAVPSILAADRVVLVHGERNNPPAYGPAPVTLLSVDLHPIHASIVSL